MTEKNYNSNILMYCDIAIPSLAMAKEWISELDTEAAKYIDIALHILEFRRNKIIDHLLFEYSENKNGKDNNNSLKETPFILTNYYLPEFEIDISIEHEDEILGGIKKALDDNLEIYGISNRLIYSLSTILRSEKEIFSTKNSGLESENREALAPINTQIIQGAVSIYSLIRHSLKIIESKLMRSDGYYICKKCGFKMLPNDNLEKCKICNAPFCNLCHLPSF